MIETLKMEENAFPEKDEIVENNDRLKIPSATDRPWEKPWSVAELRGSAHEWTLASDAGLLEHLQSFSQKLIAQTHDVQQKVNDLSHEAKLTNVRLHNSFNDFIRLTNTQFVENRVYDDNETDIEDDKETQKSNQPKSKAERQEALIPKIKQAMTLGMSVIDTAFEKLDVHAGDSGTDDENDASKLEPILEAKDPYISRPLPYLIGSEAFKNDDNVGLLDVASDIESSSDAGSYSESERSSSHDDSDSDSEELSSEEESRHGPLHKFIPAPQGMKNSSGTTQRDQSEDSDSDLFGSGDESNRSEHSIDAAHAQDSEDGDSGTDMPAPQKSFADELSSKLGGGVASKPTKKEKPPAKKTEPFKAKPAKQNDSLFRSESPPPMDDYHSDDSSPFSPNSGLFTASSKGLFDESDDEGDIFSVPKPKSASVKPAQESAKPTLGRSDSVASTISSASSRRAPPGGVSIFKGGDDGLFSASDSKPSSAAPEPTKPAKSVPSKNLGLFDSSESEGSDDGDLFSAPAKKMPPKNFTKPTVKQSVNLFADDDGDSEDDDDIFASAARAKPVEPATKQKKVPVGGVSMFGSVAPISSANVQQKDAIEKNDTPSTVSSASEDDTSAAVAAIAKPPPKNMGATSSGLFDGSSSDEDLFASMKSANITTKPNKPQMKSSHVETKPSKPEPVKQQTVKSSSVTKPSKSKVSSLFNDSDESDDLFSFMSSKKSSEKSQSRKPQTAHGAKSSAAVIQDAEEDANIADNTVASAKEQRTKKPSVQPTNKAAPSLSLFDDSDEGDLFATVPSSKDTKVKSKTKAKSNVPKSLFDDDSLFDSSSKESPEVDLFGADSPLTPKKDPFGSAHTKHKTSESDDLFITAVENSKDIVEDSIMQITGATVTSSEVTAQSSDDDDLFSVKPKIKHEVPLLFPDDEEEDDDDAEEQESRDEGEDDMFAAPVQKEPVQDASTKAPPGAVSMFGSLNPKDFLTKNEAPDSDDDLFKEKPPPREPSPVESAPDSTSVDSKQPTDKSADQSADQPADQTDLFAEPEKPAIQKPTARKTPPGAVSMFGPLNPKDILGKSRNDTPDPKDDDLFKEKTVPPKPATSVKPTLPKSKPTLPTKTPDSENLPSNERTNQKPGLPAGFRPVSAPKSKSAVANLQASLAIDPSALMGGAKAKVPGSQTSNLPTSGGGTRATMVDSTASNGATTIDFDVPAVTNTLPSYNKSRARIPTQRRRPTRSAHRTTPDTTVVPPTVVPPTVVYPDDAFDGADPLSPSSERTGGQHLHNGYNRLDSIDLTDPEIPDHPKERAASMNNLFAGRLSPLSDEGEDLFGEASNLPATHNSKNRDDNFVNKSASKSDSDDDDSLFGDKSNLPISSGKHTKTFLDDKADSGTDDGLLFGGSESVVKPTIDDIFMGADSASVEAEDLFGASKSTADIFVSDSLTVKPGAKRAATKSAVKTSVAADLFGDSGSDEEEDLFGSVQKPAVDEDMFGEVQKNIPAKRVENDTKRIKDKNVFKTAPKSTPTAAREATPPTTKATPSNTGKSMSDDIFANNDDDDLFGSSGKSVSSKKSDKSDIFADKSEDIFADTSKSKASKVKKKKTPSKAVAAKSLFGDDGIDDIFATPSPASKTKKHSSKAAPKNTPKNAPKNASKNAQKAAQNKSIFDDNTDSIFDDPLS